MIARAAALLRNAGSIAEESMENVEDFFRERGRSETAVAAALAQGGSALRHTADWMAGRKRSTPFDQT